MIRALTLLALAALTACGGGGADAPAPAPSAPAHIEPVTVALLGDSTQYGYDAATGARAVHNPGERLQADMDLQFGVGAVIVTDYGVSGSTADQSPIVAADITVANYGINDERSVDVDTFLSRMQRIGASIVETPSPVVEAGPPLNVQQQYADAERALGSQIADVFSYVLTLPDWQLHLRDGVHPDDALYALIVDNVLAPAVAQMVHARGLR